jgi:aryl-alcohol dehydrogenase-like predicted oxidoreductase
MQHRPLGRTGQSVSALGLGCMGMSEFYGARDDAESLATLEAALAAGIDFFDTADTYGHGHNEELVGRFLKGRRDQVVLATKFGIVRKPGTYERRVDNSPAYIRAGLRRVAQAPRRRADRSLLHAPPQSRRAGRGIGGRDGGIGAAGQGQGARPVRSVGRDLAPRAQGASDRGGAEANTRCGVRDPEQGMLQACAELGVTFVAYSPLGRAFLTGTVSNPDTLPEGDFRKASPRFQAEALERNNRLVAALEKFAAEHKAKPAQVALAWLLGKHPHVVPIPGTKRRTYLAENAAAGRTSS